MKTRKQPCESCPWRVNAHTDDIPGFSLELAEGLANTSRDAQGYGPEYMAPMMACHGSGPEPGGEIACAGWLAMEGSAHPMARIAAMNGEIDPALLEPGDDWPELHTSFVELIEKHRRQEIEHRWVSTGTVDTGHNPTRTLYECKRCGQQSWGPSGNGPPEQLPEDECRKERR